MKQKRFAFTDRKDLHWKELPKAPREKLLGLLGLLLLQACERREGGKDER